MNVAVGFCRSGPAVEPALPHVDKMLALGENFPDAVALVRERKAVSHVETSPLTRNR